MPFKVIAERHNNTLRYSKDKVYEAHISQRDRTILFIENDLGDKIVVNAHDFRGYKKED